MAGTDLESPLPWPALVADQLGVESVNHAWPGIGNLRISESVLMHSDPDDLHVIGWTWIDRFDYVNSHTEHWHTVRPGSDHALADHYYRDLHSQYRDMLTNLMYVRSALEHLIQQKSRFIMTYMDPLLFEPVMDSWHPSAAITGLQNRIRPYCCDFQGRTFLQWSRDLGFAESAFWHPLDAAHAAAADIMLPTVRALIN